jgi:two-component sensor histidine kinase
MAHAHDLLTSRSWTGANLADVASRALEAFMPRVEMSGPDVELPPKCVLALSMALHELATNATKYGALSCPEGRVSVQWRKREGLFDLDWEETGGPPVVPPTAPFEKLSRSFGTK